MYGSRDIKEKYIKIDSNKKLDYYYKTIASIRIEDSKKNRFTDCVLSIAIRNGRVKLLLTHEKGYPSQDLGVVEKQITLNWVNNELPKI